MSYPTYTVRPAVKEDEPFLWEMLYYAAHMIDNGKSRLYVGDPEGPPHPASPLPPPYGIMDVSYWARVESVPSCCSRPRMPPPAVGLTSRRVMRSL